MPEYLTQLDVENDVFDRLPRVCLCRNQGSGEPVLIKRGVAGFYELAGDCDVERFNAERDITSNQCEAMLAGSMFGWDTPGSDPAHYDGDGDYIKQADR